MMHAMPASSEFIDWETGAMTPSQEIAFFQRLIDSGSLETLNSRYQARAQKLIELEAIFT